jgi:gamma-glutamyl:cysteine ligase YbdK (ATP-grasp superfamily)
MADLETGERQATRERVLALLEAVAPAAARVGAEGPLAEARRLARAGGAERLRAVAHERGVRGACEWLADQFSARVPVWA